MPCAAMQSDFHTEVHSHRRPNAVAKDIGKGEGVRGEEEYVHYKREDEIQSDCNAILAWDHLLNYAKFCGAMQHGRSSCSIRCP